MMRSTTPAAAIALGLSGVALGVAGCSDDGGGNPRTLWLANDGLEIYVKLVDEQPPPF